MKRIIVDYKKLTTEILSLLVEKFPDGYGDDDIIHFKNSRNEAIEALEVRTEDTIYLVKVSTRLAYSMENFDEDEDDFTPPPNENMSADQVDMEDTASNGD